MTPTQLKDTNAHYADMFCDDISADTLATLEDVEDTDDLEMIREDISAES